MTKEGEIRSPINFNLNNNNDNFDISNDGDATNETRKPGQPIDLSHLSSTYNKAIESFDKIDDCIYSNKSLGKAQQNLEESYCDCYLHPNRCCDQHSDCINRLTYVECLLNDCKTGPQCQNQRFQNKEYANIDVIDAGKKGFGIRANESLEKNKFVIEYIGEVVTSNQFLRRMHTYSKEGIKHFYFMMLQKDEFIDATRKGNIGRFLNHSCAPNCFVAKWVVGKYVRMGIFTKRRIEKGEELTFNYNVDRYGHDAQPCYCGEPNCVGFIGGKTQTDIGGMDDQILDALGITQQEVLEHQLKGNRKKKSKKLDEDYELKLKPMETDDVPKVITAVRQSSTNKKILIKLLKRMNITEDNDIQRRMMRMHGFAIHSSILSEYLEDEEIIKVVLNILVQWSKHLKVKNKIETSKINEPVKSVYDKYENEEMKETSQNLLNLWATLESAYRIPKRGLNQTEDDILKAENEAQPIFAESKKLKLTEYDDGFRSNKIFERPQVPANERDESTKSPPTRAELEKERKEKAEITLKNNKDDKEAIAKVIEHAKKLDQLRQEELNRKMQEEEHERKHKKEENDKRKKNKSNRNDNKSEGNGLKDEDKRIHKVIGELVVKSMSKFKDKFEHDSFKKHAKTLTETLAEKEKKNMKNSKSNESKFDLNDDKKVKMKKFIKQYIDKLLNHKEQKLQQKQDHNTNKNNYNNEDKLNNINDNDKEEDIMSE